MATRVLPLLLLLAAPAQTPAQSDEGPLAKRLLRSLAPVHRVRYDANRVGCSFASQGQWCFDTGHGDGSVWPRPVGRSYIFSAGPQVAAVIGADGGPWAGDTTGAFFFDPKGTTENGEEAAPIYDSAVPADAAAWPAAAYVPQGDASAELYAPHLRGRATASERDLWWLTWDGNPQLQGGRPHPLGVLGEFRVLGWNGPSSNEDIIYVVSTWYNITSTDPADYAHVRPAMREVLLELAERLRDLVAASDGAALPDGGYTFTEFRVGHAGDFDVAGGSSNFSSVSFPLSLAYTYQAQFTAPAGWPFPLEVHATPFARAPGLAGLALLHGPAAAPPLTVFSETDASFSNLGPPGDVADLHRYLAGEFGDLEPRCNAGPVAVTRVCYLSPVPNDSRFYGSGPAATLGPGEFVTTVHAYVFAAPVAVAGLQPGAEHSRGDPTILGDAPRMAAGANLIDSIAGYRGFDDRDGDGNVSGGELDLVPRSLYAKARLAQVFLQTGFTAPEVPETPDFFLIPGDASVTVVWRPSASETEGDRFFALAHEALLPDGSANPLYDPNYREFDVEGYRIYRGRTDAPESLELVAQFDYTGTAIMDHAGQVQPQQGCAPELGITVGCDFTYDPVSPGVARSAAVEHPLVSEIVQVRLGDRVAADGDATVVLRADTVGTGVGLGDTRVPFVWVDHGLSNSSRYFYAVSAFDVNSVESGPATLESPRQAKAVIPRPTASNVASKLEYGERMMFGRGTALTLDAPIPTITPSAGTFDGPFPPANAWDLRFVSAVSQVLDGTGAIRARLDSISAGNYWHDEPHVFWFTGINAAGEETGTASAPIVQDFVERTFETHSGAFLAAPLGAGAEQFGGSRDFSLTAQVDLQLPGGYFSIGWGRGWAFGPQAPGFENVEISQYNGPRWFTGETEPANPVANNAITPTTFAEWSNAGALPNVNVIHAPRAYLQGYPGAATREYEGVLGPYARGADLNVYWGEGGIIDSVIDVTHNVVVEFDPRGQTGYGLLTAASATGPGSVDNAPGVVSFGDYMCTEPQYLHATGAWACTGDTPYQLVATATLSPVAIANSPAALAAAAAAVPADQQGFGLYMPGHFFLMEIDQVPADGTVWTLRSYIGAFGGGGAEPYVFHEAPLPLTATGVEIQLDYQATNAVTEVAAADLRRVHTVPDPFYLRSGYGSAVGDEAIQFVNLPAQAIIRIYSLSGVLVTILEHDSPDQRDAIVWNLRNRDGTPAAPGVYFYHVESGSGRAIGKFTIVPYAP